MFPCISLCTIIYSSASFSLNTIEVVKSFLLYIYWIIVFTYVSSAKFSKNSNFEKEKKVLPYGHENIFPEKISFPFSFRKENKKRNCKLFSVLFMECYYEPASHFPWNIFLLLALRNAKFIMQRIYLRILFFSVVNNI